jgi:hypothetical protein
MHGNGRDDRVLLFATLGILAGDSVGESIGGIPGIQADAYAKYAAMQRMHCDHHGCARMILQLADFFP